jgi:hypothetical protein
MRLSVLAEASAIRAARGVTRTRVADRANPRLAELRTMLLPGGAPARRSARRDHDDAVRALRRRR